MNLKLITSNLLFVIALFFMIGGGIYIIYGYLFLLIYLVLICIMFPSEMSCAFFSKDSAFLYIYLLYVFFTSDFNINTCVAYFSTFAPCALVQTKLCILVKRESYKKQEKFFFLVILAIFLFYCYKSFELLKSNPMALRLLISTEKDDSIIVGGGYALPYSLSIMCPALMLNIRNIFNRVTRFSIYVFIVIGSTIVVSSMFTTAILFLFLGFTYVLFIRVGKDKRNIFVAISFFTMLFLFPVIKDYFLELDANVVGRRLVEIDNIIKGNKGEDEGDFLSRVDLLLSSLETFLSNPIIGVGPSVDYDYFEMEKQGVGSHSQWFDIFAVSGLFSMFLLIYINRKTKNISKGNMAFITFVLLGFFNPIFFFTLVFVTYYMVPMFNYLWSSQNE